MRRSARQYAESLDGALRDGGQLKEVAGRLRFLLRRDRSTKLLPRILAHYEALLRDQRHARIVHITTAQGHSQKALHDEIGQHVVGSIECVSLVDPKLVGGAVIQIGDRRVDGSVSHALTELSRLLCGTSANSLPHERR